MAQLQSERQGQRLKLFGKAAEEASDGVFRLGPPPIDGPPLSAASDYIRLRVLAFHDPSSMAQDLLKNRRKRELIDHTAVQLALSSSADRQADRSVQLQSFLSPDTNSQTSGAQLGRMIQRDLHGLGPVPFRNDLEMQIRLYSVQNPAAISGSLDILTSIARQASVPFIDEARRFAGLLGDGINTLRGFSDGLRLEIGLSQLIPAHGGAGIYAIAYNGSGRLSREGLGVREDDGELVHLANGRIVDDPYIVFRIEALKERPDWAKLPDIGEAWEEARSLALNGSGREEMKQAMRRVQRVMTMSPDLTETQARQLVALVDDRLNRLDETFESADGMGGFCDLGPLEGLASGDGADMPDWADHAYEASGAEGVRFDVTEHIPAIEDYQRDHPAFLKAVMSVFGKEGGHVDNVHDFGGETMKGVTRAIYDAWRRENGWPLAPLGDLIAEEAMAIYYENFWKAGGCDSIEDAELALLLFDTSVLFGPRRAQRMLQMALLGDSGLVLNSLSVKRFVDGRIGRNTLKVLEQAVAKAGGRDKVMATFLSLRAGYHRARVIQETGSRHQGEFVVGWLSRVRQLHAEVMGTAPDPSAYTVWGPVEDMRLAAPGSGVAWGRGSSRGGSGPDDPPGDRSVSDRPVSDRPVSGRDIFGDVGPVEVGFGEESATDDAALETIAAEDVLERASQEARFFMTEPSGLSARLSELRSTRSFELLAALALAVEDAGGILDPASELHLIQALNDTGELEAARERAHRLALSCLGPDGRPTPETFEIWEEATGMIGRSWKQEYVNRRARSGAQAMSAEDALHLSKAVDHYRQLFNAGRDKAVWGGINVAACVAMAERDGLDAGIGLTSGEVAERVIALVGNRSAAGTADIWDLASEAEALVALGDYSGAIGKYAEVVQQQHADYQKRLEVDSSARFRDFVISSAVRQLDEVWGVNAHHENAEARELHNSLIGMLVRLNHEDGATVAPSFAEDALPSGGDDGMFEMVPGPPNPLDLASEQLLETIYQRPPIDLKSWMQRMPELMRAIARIDLNRTDPRTGRRSPKGSGFLVAGEVFRDEWHGRKLLVTNEHVISDSANRLNRRPLALLPASAIVVFTHGDPDGEYRVRRILWQSSRDYHDVSICELDREPDGIEPIRTYVTLQDAFGQEQAHDISGVTVIGHPSGRPLEFAPFNLDVLWHDAPCPLNSARPERIHYRSSTEGGNSGSPAVDIATLTLVGVHHAGAGLKLEYEQANGRLRVKNRQRHNANEAISFASICRAVKAYPRGID